MSRLLCTFTSIGVPSPFSLVFQLFNNTMSQQLGALLPAVTSCSEFATVHSNIML